MLDKTLLVACAVLCVLLLFNSHQNGKLQAELTKAQGYITEIVKSNENLHNDLNATREQYLKQAELFKAMADKKRVEVRYVTEYKDRIIKDENASCVNTANDIFKRLQFKTHY